MAIEYNSEEMLEKYGLNSEQKKAAKAVFSAMRKAGKLGVEFWDMYGTLTAYNGKKFRGISMDDIPNAIQVVNSEGSELTYWEQLENFSPGCSDDDALTYIRLGYNGYLNLKITEKHNDGVSFEYEYKSSKRRRKFAYRFNYVSQYSPNVAQLDFLRSKGYALPWMNLNIDTLEKYGWIKLKEN
ncbi:hypothetical protein [Chryseobacterium sp. JV274]|uniref:hypothetical protein n=1 Tax=Chryseobacterium sp. JV274 TaxID=1932669 RepID=UPI0015C22FE7|nr:hypothetical protein [Chryseobacterium sp. JV274]CAD0220376.1 protein of unknown function [Chryseobacterium sp. JV274]